MVSAAGAEGAKKIILFYDDVSQAEKDEYASDWETYGVSTVMDLPFMNGMVLMVPDEITTEELADDYRVASVESDGKVELQAIEATGEGGAGEGGAGEGGAEDLPPEPITFITPYEELPGSQISYGVLSVLQMPYDPHEITDLYIGSFLSPLARHAKQRWVLEKVNVAVFDTGIDPYHSRLFNRGRSIVRSGIDLVHMIDTIPMDDNGHGTHVAGTLAGNNVGIAEGVNIYSVKVLDEYATGDISTIIMGLQWAIDHNIDIVNMSFAFRDDHPAVRLAVQEAHAAGIIMVAATGNHSNWEDDGGTGEGGAGEGGAGEGGAGEGGAGEGGAGEGGAGEGGAGEGGAGDDGTTGNPYPVMYPAAYPEVIAVGAHDSFGDMAAFSNTGPEMDIAAPGVDIYSGDLNQGFGICSGTSMATPHVTGAVAMMLGMLRDADMTLTPADAKTILMQTTFDGIIDLVGALEEIDYRIQNDQGVDGNRQRR
jgi:subtilisin family serine protease